MCDWRGKANAQFKRLKDYFIENVFPSFVNQLPPSSVRPNHCLLCGEPLTHNEMYPVGHPPRYMHQACYEEIAYNSPVDKCLTCGGQLPAHKVQARLNNPRELKNALHDGPCEEYHSVLAGLVFGLPFKTSQARSETPLLTNNNSLALSSPKKPVKALPFPGLGSSFDNIFSPMDLSSGRQAFSKPERKIKYARLLK